MTVTVDAVGSLKAPANWWMKTKINMQRLYYIKGGTGFYKCSDGSLKRFEHGKFYIHPYNLAADFVNDPNDPLDHVFFDFLSVPAIISPCQKVYSQTPELKRLTEALEECLKHHKISDSKALYSSFLTSFLLLLEKESPLPAINDTAILHALDIFHSRHAESLSISSVAAELGFETNHFIRRFRKTMGVTPYSYLRTVRLVQAKEMIESGHSLTEASYAVGYENPSSLSRALKNW